MAIVAGLAALVAYVSITAVRIAHQSAVDEARPADVIMILGAAEYHGHPSPVLRARLDHALELYRRKLAPLMLTTGGAGGDRLFTEGGVGRSYLISHGVPAESIIIENEGDSTMSSTALAGEILSRMGLHSVIVVSDGYHIYRVKKILQSRGFAVYGSPRKENGREAYKDPWNCFKQAIGYVLWRAGLAV